MVFLGHLRGVGDVSRAAIIRVRGVAKVSREEIIHFSSTFECHASNLRRKHFQVAVRLRGVGGISRAAIIRVRVVAEVSREEIISLLVEHCRMPYC